ncbi:hypothetical protein ST37_02365 (plasmid) [Vibrio sp. qd031]|nr:hypothetical protein ST37_02365 [Vibrio sp. qd031]
MAAFGCLRYIRCSLVAKIFYGFFGVIYLIYPEYENFKEYQPPFKIADMLSVKTMAYNLLSTACALLNQILNRSAVYLLLKCPNLVP